MPGAEIVLVPKFPSDEARRKQKLLSHPSSELAGPSGFGHTTLL